MRLWGFLCCAVLAACGPTQINLPKGSVVSTSLCADGYLHALPNLEPRIAALSWQSRSALSVTPSHLRSLPQAGSDPERNVQWKNAIRISTAGGRGDIDLKWGEDFDSVWENLDILSTQLSVPNPTARLKNRLDKLTRPETELTILYLDRSGATAGPGTFVDAVIQTAGGTNIIQTPGWQSPDTEFLVQFTPDLIITSFMKSNYSGINDRAFRHSALAKKIQSVPQINIPGKYWPCAGPGLVDAAEVLSQAMLAL